jgi:hypothetical protein
MSPDPAKLLTKLLLQRLAAKPEPLLDVMRRQPRLLPLNCDITLEAMKQLGLPLTRQQYLKSAGLVEPLGAEEESLIPRQFQLNPPEIM